MPEFELMSHSTTTIISPGTTATTTEEGIVASEIANLMKQGSQELQDDVVITRSAVPGGRDPQHYTRTGTVTLDLKGNRRPFVRVWGINGEKFLWEVLDLLRKNNYLDGREWFFPQVGLFIDQHGVEHWPPEGDEYKLRPLPKTSTNSSTPKGY